MLKSIFALYFSLSFSFCFGQIIHAITSVAPSERDFSDLETLAIPYDKLKVLAMGEATHGTSEFTQFRHRMFVYLVNEHAYNTVFLEVDYSFAITANQFVQNVEGITERDVMLSIGYWPSQTHEMLALFRWMREYNKTHSNALQVIGTEGQDFISPLKMIAEEFKSKNISFEIDSGFYKKDQYKDLILNKVEMQSFFKIVEKSAKDYTELDVTDQERIHVEQLTKNIKQSFEKKTAKDRAKKGHFRNKSISDNIVFHLAQNKQAKGVYFAHNAHITKEKFWKYGGAGFYLNKKLHKTYYCIAQAIVSGEFVALTKPKDSTFYQLEAYDYPNSNEKSLSFIYKDSIQNNAFVVVKEQKKRKEIELINVGSIINSGDEIFHEKGIDGYDAVMLIKKSSPLNLYYFDTENGQKKPK